MKCRECPDYAKCVKESNLTIKRKNCPKANTEKVKTNADRIRALSDEELAKWILQFVVDCAEKTTGEECEFEDGSEDALVNWLKQPAEGE